MARVFMIDNRCNLWVSNHLYTSILLIPRGWTVLSGRIQKYSLPNL